MKEAATKVVGVIGGGTVDAELTALAREVGALLARHGYAIVCGGLGGVMAAASRGARAEGGTVIGILPGPDPSAANPDVTWAIATNMGHARNAVIVHTAAFLVAIGGEAGTLSEIAFALKLARPVYALRSWDIPGVVQVANCHELARLLARDGWLPAVRG